MSLVAVFTLCCVSSYQHDTFNVQEKSLSPGADSEAINKGIHNNSLDHNRAINPSLMNFSMKSYFQNFASYSPMNSRYSCGYVSFIQYLSYYDTFLNDSMIRDVYERSQGNVYSFNAAIANSPGVLRQNYIHDDISLRDFINDNKHNDFQMHLMNIYNEYYNYKDTYLDSIHMRSYNILLDSLYGLNKRKFSFKDSKSFGQDNYKHSDVVNGFDQYVKSILDSGHPVMLHVYGLNPGDTKEYYNSVVAYYYDEKGIHINNGTYRSENDTLLSDKKYYIAEVGVLNFSSIPETHSNNYIINGLRYCGCGIHTHYNDQWIQYDNTKHIEKCNCGVVRTIKAGHVVSASDTGRYRNCIECGYLVDLENDNAFVESRNFGYTISTNGSYKLANGIIVLVEEDFEAYYNGSLVFE